MGKILKSVSEIADRDQREVVIPDEYSVIGPRAFRGCASIQRVEIPGTVTEIADSAFRGCKALADVQIPNSVTTIGVRAFEGCVSLVSVMIPKSVTEIGDGAFDGCRRLEKIEAASGSRRYCGVDGALYSKNRTVLLCVPKTVRTFEIPDGHQNRGQRVQRL